jgi:Tfp pilus assembly protein PilZ
MPLDASDQVQLLGATAQGRCLFTFNIRDFMALAARYPKHGGLILAAQANWSVAELVSALDRLLTETEEADWTGQVRWLNEWRG